MIGAEGNHLQGMAVNSGTLDSHAVLPNLHPSPHGTQRDDGMDWLLGEIEGTA